MIARDVVVSALLEDMLAGRPVVYADFLGYDEVAHHSGIERADSLAVLRTIDQQIGRLYRAAALAPRPYQLVVPVRPRADPGLGVHRPVRRVRRAARRPALRPGVRPSPGAAAAPAPGGQPPAGRGLAGRRRAGRGGGPIARRLRARVEAARGAARPRRRARRRPARSRGSRPASSCSVSGHTALVVVHRPPGPGVAGDDRAALPTCCPASSTTPASASCWCTATSSARWCSAATGCTGCATGVVIGEDPLLPLRPARGGAGRPRRRRSRTAPTS